jgi:hypothetical protein
MLQRVQTALMFVLLAAVIALGVAFYRAQRENEAMIARMVEIIGKFPNSPTVVATVPAIGDNKVDPSLSEIRVTFDRPMKNGSWSWCYDSSQLKPSGTPYYEEDRKTCVLPVQLEPGKSYELWLNTERFQNFRDTAGNPSIPYELKFVTRQ